MPEIRNTTSEEALRQALERLEDARQYALRDLQQTFDKAVTDLKLREVAVGDLSGRIERAKHAYVKDATPYSPTKLLNLRLGNNDGLDVQFAESARYQSERDAAPTLVCRPYRFWLLIEEIQPDAPPAEVGHGG